MSRESQRSGDFLSRVFGGQRRLTTPAGDITGTGLCPIPAGFSSGFNEHDTSPFVDRNTLIEGWSRLPRRISSYKAGTHPDGTSYPAGRTLTIGEEMVMDTFEEQWCRTTVDMMFDGKRGPQTIIERGFGLGIMSEFIYRQMLTRGGTYFIVELNNGVHADAQKWTEAKQKELARMKYPPELTITLLPPMDADEAMRQFGPRSFDLIFSDTHQIRPEERGINDLLKPAEMVSRLKPDGRVSICAFHKGNQTDGLDPKQTGLRQRHFREQRLKAVELIPPAHSTYLDGPKTHVAAAVFSDPIYPDQA